VEHHALLEIALIVALAAGAHVIASWTRIPAILLLVVAGFFAGPVTGLLDPDHLFGDLLLPVVSIAIALILFEGGLTLDFRELRGVGSVVVRLLSVGVLLTWLLVAAAALLIFDAPLNVALLIGAVLVVSGPTVVLPILRQLRIAGSAESVLRWEGIVIDPIGVILGVVTFELIVAGQSPSSVEAIAAFTTNMAAGVVLGLVGALILVPVLRSGRLDERTEVVLTLAAILGAFAIANQLAEEAGLVSATLMGIVLANQRDRDFHHIHAFKETLGLLLTGALFVILTARVPQDLLVDLGWSGVIFLAVLVIVIRPIAAWVSTIGSSLDWRERVLIGAMAPRGIFAASTASVFALGLERADVAGAEVLLPAVFIVIIGSVVVYGLGLPVLARALGMVSTGPPNALLVGGHPWVRALAAQLSAGGIPTTIWATSAESAESARADGLRVREADLLSREFELDEQLNSLDLALILTDNDEFNALASDRMREFLSATSVFQISSRPESRLKGSLAFTPQLTFEQLSTAWGLGARVELRGAQGQDVPQLQPGDRVLAIITDGTVEIPTSNTTDPDPG